MDCICWTGHYCPSVKKNHLRLIQTATIWWWLTIHQWHANKNKLVTPRSCPHQSNTPLVCKSTCCDTQWYIIWQIIFSWTLVNGVSWEGLDLSLPASRPLGTLFLIYLNCCMHNNCLHLLTQTPPSVISPTSMKHCWSNVYKTFRLPPIQIITHFLFGEGRLVLSIILLAKMISLVGFIIKSC